MLDARQTLLFPKLCEHNVHKPIARVSYEVSVGVLILLPNMQKPQVI